MARVRQLERVISPSTEGGKIKGVQLVERRCIRENGANDVIRKIHFSEYTRYVGRIA